MLNLYLLLAIAPAPVGVADRTLSPTTIVGDSAPAIQQAIDELASLPADTPRRLYLNPGLYKLNAKVVLPYDTALSRRNIQIISKVNAAGDRAVFAPLDPENPPPKFIEIGNGWQTWTVPDGMGGEKPFPKLTGIRVQGIHFLGGITHLTIEGDDGTAIDQCTFEGSRDESLINYGANGSINTKVTRCRGRNCGLVGPGRITPVALYNLNGEGSLLFDSTAIDCGWGAEIGGTRARITRCHFENASVEVGSVGGGISDVEFNSCRFFKSYFGYGNGIGKCDNIRARNCVFIDGAVRHGGGTTANNVDYPFLPWKPGPSLVENCTFLRSKPGVGAQGIRLTDWADYHANGSGLIVRSNTFILPAGTALVMQGRLKAPVLWEKNFISNCDDGDPLNVGTITPGLPDGSALPDTTAFIKFGTGYGANLTQPGMKFIVQGGVLAGWPAAIEVK